VIGYVEKELRSIIKKSGHYAIQGILKVLPQAHEELSKDSLSVMMCEGTSCTAICKPLASSSGSNMQGARQQLKAGDRKGKGTNGLIVVKELLANKENWRLPENDADWQYPGISCKERDQCVLYF